ncbi:MAG: phosphatase PAP2 family protein [Planctomycetia bacterium]|nr:phosphatase PAP2 family protein [Planctomycetia bacterium]
MKSVPGVLWADTKSLFTWPNAIILGAAAGGVVALRDDVDLKVRNETAEHPSRWGEGSEVLRQFGEFSYQVPVLAGAYAASLWTQDETLHEFSLSTLSAYGLTAAATVTIKGITNTQRPTDAFQNGHYGFPSYHSASTFCIAACIEEYYGWKAGLPAYVLAGLVGWSRIDQREHDLSDVLFGAVLGVVIGKTVSAAHLDRQADLSISPYYDARNQATGIAIEKRY